MILLHLGFGFALSIPNMLANTLPIELAAIQKDVTVKTKHHDSRKKSKAAFQSRQQGRMSVH